jgi:hypothetical protein
MSELTKIEDIIKNKNSVIYRKSTSNVTDIEINTLNHKWILCFNSSNDSLYQIVKDSISNNDLDIGIIKDLLCDLSISYQYSITSIHEKLILTNYTFIFTQKCTTAGTVDFILEDIEDNNTSSISNCSNSIPLFINTDDDDYHNIGSLEEIKSNKCTCGADSVGSPFHSSWCDKR